MIKLIVRGIRKLYFHIIKNFSRVITVSTDYGPFRIHTHDRIIGYSLYKDKKWEMDFPRDVFSFLKEKKFVRDEITLIDLGANIGITSIPFYKSGWITNSIAVEPDAENFLLLEENVRLNGLDQKIATMNYAVTEETTELVLERSETNYGDHRIKRTSHGGAYNEHLRQSITVKGDTLPNLVKISGVNTGDHSLVIWIDIQGHEGYCFRGAKSWLTEKKPVTISEIWPYGILRSGMSLDEFGSIVSSIWSTYFVWQNGKFVHHPIGDLPALMNELHAHKDRHENIILVP